MDFFMTRMGKTFFEGTMPRIAKALEELNALKRRELELKERELDFKEEELLRLRNSRD